MHKKTYEKPEAELVPLLAEDIMNASGEKADEDDNIGEWDPVSLFSTDN